MVDDLDSGDVEVDSVAVGGECDCVEDSLNEMECLVPEYVDETDVVKLNECEASETDRWSESESEAVGESDEVCESDAFQGDTVGVDDNVGASVTGKGGVIERDDVGETVGDKVGTVHGVTNSPGTPTLDISGHEAMLLGGIMKVPVGPT